MTAIGGPTRKLQYEVFQIPGDQTREQSCGAGSTTPIATFGISYDARDYCKQLDKDFSNLFFVMVDIFKGPVDWVD
jgi:hypothetical protein